MSRARLVPQDQDEPTPAGRNWWQWATYGLTLLTLVLALDVVWVLHSPSSYGVHLYNTWVHQTRLVAHGTTLSSMQARNLEARGIGEAGTAMLGHSGTTSSLIAADLNRVSGSLYSIISITIERRTQYPAYTSRNAQALHQLLSRVVHPLPASVGSPDDLSRLLSTLNGVTSDVEKAAAEYAANFSAQP